MLGLPICTNSWRFGVTELPVGGFGEYEDLFAGYESVTGQKVDAEHVKFWEVFGSFWWAVGCLGMAEHYRSGPDQTVERPAIGRRSSECQVDCVNLLIPGPVELIEPQDLTDSDDMPRADELLISVRDFLRDAEVDYQRVFLARSDPALNYGVVAAELMLKIALCRLDRLEAELGIPLYPIIGVARSPSAGTSTPETWSAPSANTPVPTR